MKSRRECANGSFRLKSPKTTSGKRVTVIAERSVEKLKEFLEGKPNGKFLMCTTTGNGIRRSNWSNVMKRLRKESGYPKHMTFHSLRHYCATRWCQLGMLMPDISHILGHANTYITETLYLHGDSSSVERAKALTREVPATHQLEFVAPTIDNVIAYVGQPVEEKLNERKQ
jgi:integrase